MKTVEQQIAESRDIGELHRWVEAIRRRIREISEEFAQTEDQPHGRA